MSALGVGPVGCVALHHGLLVWFAPPSKATRYHLLNMPEILVVVRIEGAIDCRSAASKNWGASSSSSLRAAAPASHPSADLLLDAGAGEAASAGAAISFEVVCAIVAFC